MIVSAEYNDGSIEPITDYTFSPDGVLTDSDTVITISAYGFTATVNVTVSNVEIVESYIVTGVPTDALSVGDPLPTIDASAITVTAHYYSGNTKTFSASEYELSVPTGNAELGSAVVITLKDESGTKIARCFNVSRKIDLTKFFKAHCFRPGVYFETPVIEIPLYSEPVSKKVSKR